MYQRLVHSWNSGWTAWYQSIGSLRDIVGLPWRGLLGGARGYRTVCPQVGAVSPLTQNLRWVKFSQMEELHSVWL